jgi:N-acetylglucosamine-6-phosphate deacetylase
MAQTVNTAPYFIDIHVHGAADFDTRTRRQDDIMSIANIHGKHGTSAIVPTIYAGSLDIMRDNMTAVKRAMTMQRSGARILGVHLEGPFLNPEWGGAMDKASFLEPSTEALSFEQAEEGKRAGATGITHLFNAMRGFHHREPGLVGFGLMDEDIYVEIISDKAHLHHRSLKMVMDMKQPDKILLVSDSVKGPGWGLGPIRGPGGVLLGSGITLKDSIQNLISLGVPADKAARFASDNPMKYLGITSVA